MAEIILMLVVFALSFAIGFLLISKVPQRLHTPLMSMTNAISAVTILGALLLFSVEMDSVSTLLGALALLLAAFNMVGGFFITHRMLGFFTTKHD